VVTVTVATGVLTVPGIVTDGREPVGTGSVEGDSEDVTASTVDGGAKACVALPVEAGGADAEGVVATPKPVLTGPEGRCPDSGAGARRTGRPARAGRLPD
jgi:hypothetical protein